MRKVRSDRSRSVLKLEAMPEYEIVAAPGKIAKAFLELGGSGGLGLRDLCAQLVSDGQQSFVRQCVPASIAHRSGREECDLERGVVHGCGILGPRTPGSENGEAEKQE